MKLTARKDVNLDNDYVDVRYRELTPAIHQIFQLCEDTGSVLLCEKDNATHNVDINDILYIEAVDRKSCVYTKDDVYYMAIPLAQLEGVLTGQHFIRISKMALVNIFKIKSAANSLHFRMIVEMTNGESIIVGRRYRENLIEAISELAKEVSS